MMSFPRMAWLLSLATLASVSLGFAVGSASATRLSITNGVRLATASGRLTLVTAGLNLTCNLTLGIELTSSITKTPLATIGTVLLSGSGSAFGGCSLGITAVVLNGMILGYTNFLGSLPNITSIGSRINNVAFSVTLPAFGSCLYTGSMGSGINRNTATGAMTTANLNATNTLVSRAGCPSPLSVSGTLTFAATQPVVRLI